MAEAKEIVVRIKVEAEELSRLQPESIPSSNGIYFAGLNRLPEARRGKQYNNTDVVQLMLSRGQAEIMLGVLQCNTNERTGVIDTIYRELKWECDKWPPR